MRAVAAIAVAYLVLAQPTLAYRTGDTTPMARKAQFNKMRTEWHDVLGQYCPHFAVNRLVALPLPRPNTYDARDDLKIAISLDHDRVFTPWLKVIDAKDPSKVPMLDLKLRYSGGDLTGIRARVLHLPDRYAAVHEESVAHFANATHWPKLVVTKYSWEEEQSVDVGLGLTTVSAIGALLAAFLMANAVAGSRQGLAHLGDMVQRVLDDEQEVEEGGAGRGLKGE